MAFSTAGCAHINFQLTLFELHIPYYTFSSTRLFRITFIRVNVTTPILHIHYYTITFTFLLFSMLLLCKFYPHLGFSAPHSVVHIFHYTVTLQCYHSACYKKIPCVRVFSATSSVPGTFNLTLLHKLHCCHSSMLCIPLCRFTRIGCTPPLTVLSFCIHDSSIMHQTFNIHQITH